MAKKVSQVKKIAQVQPLSQPKKPIAGDSQFRSQPVTIQDGSDRSAAELRGGITVTRRTHTPHTRETSIGGLLKNGA